MKKLQFEINNEKIEPPKVAVVISIPLPKDLKYPEQNKRLENKKQERMRLQLTTLKNYRP